MQSKFKKLATLTGLALGLTLVTTPAHAGFIVAAIVTWATAAVVAAPILVPLIIGAAVIGASILITKKSKESAAAMDMGSAADFAQSGNQGIMVNKTGSSQSIPVIYGETRTGGIRVFAHTEGTVGSGDDEINNAYLHLAFVIAEGEVGACKKIYFDGVEAGSTSTTGSSDHGNWSIASPWSGKVQMYFRPGTDSQAEITQLGDLKGSWSPHFKGIAYAYLRLEYESDVWTNGLPEITFLIDGKKTRDPNNLGATPTSNNRPARAVLDYLTNTRYGKGLSTDDLDMASFIAADTYANNHGFECRGNLITSGTLYANLNDLLSSCRGYLTFGNKYRLLIDQESNETPVEITDANTVGNLQYDLADKSQLYNKMTAKFLDAATEYKDNVKVLTSSALKTKDNGLDLEAEISLPFTKTLSVATQILTEEINQSRQSHTISLTCTVEAIDIQVGDLVNITNETFGITSKTFRVLSSSLDPSNEVTLVCREYDEHVYGSSIITDELADNND